MTESVRILKFEHFRGLPRNDFTFKGRNVVLLGANGKGKSAIVDGIEYLFAGQVGRFVGAGTAGIDHDDAIQHIKKLGTPKVTIALSPSNGTISRRLDAAQSDVTNKESVKVYLATHQTPDAFILRRNKILEFIGSQDADRYKKFVQLLGITQIDAVQRAFVDAEKQSKEFLQRHHVELQRKLFAFVNPAAAFNPTSLAQIIAQISKDVESFGLEKVMEWSAVASRLELLKARRPEANREVIEKLTRALINFETLLPAEVEGDIDIANAACEIIDRLNASSADAAKLQVISEAAKYLEANELETECPVCERDFSSPFTEVISRLKAREEALSLLTEAIARRQTAIKRIFVYAYAIAKQLKEDLRYKTVVEQNLVQALTGARSVAISWARKVARIQRSSTLDAIESQIGISNLTAIRGLCANDVNKRKAALISPDVAKLEGAIALLERASMMRADIALSEVEVARSAELVQRASDANAAYTKAREDSIQKIFDQIAGTVLEFYRKLHDAEEFAERSECTGLKLTVSSRAAAGSLKLAIQFLGQSKTKDPRAFLSEGHLDSLGLCLFLATVHTFNPPGSLLVLDDVLTSIDRDHRRRVGELLFQEFSQFQLIITTHDEHWQELLNSTARAWGVQDKWSFLRLESWTVETGPSHSEVGGSWDYINEHLVETDYRELGGPFRSVFEDFVKRAAAKLEFRVRFKYDGKYTGGDFVTVGIADVVRDKLLAAAPEDDKDIRTDVARVFGQGDMINFLSHDNPGKLEVTFDQARDFVTGLQSLTKRCETHGFIRGK